MKKLVVFAIAAFLVGCGTTTAPDRSVGIPDTPDYWKRTVDITPKTIDVKIVNRAWGLYCPKHLNALACADRYAGKGKCEIFINAKTAHPYEHDWIIDHEKCHCLGYDHPDHMKRGPGFLHNFCPANTHLMPHTFSTPILND